MQHGVELLGYGDLYALWERQQWAVGDLDFTQDRIDWHEGLGARFRGRRLAVVYSFLLGEQHVAMELGPMMRACPRDDMRMFLCTQIADEARHAVFFSRFLEAIGVNDGGLDAQIEEAQAHTTGEFAALLHEMLSTRVERLAVEPDDLGTLVEAITIYHMVIEGMVALAGQQAMIDTYSRAGLLPGLVAGLTNVARDEHRHVAFGARFLADVVVGEPRYEASVRGVLAEAVPLAERTLGAGAAGTLGADRAPSFGREALERRLKVIGLTFSP